MAQNDTSSCLSGAIIFQSAYDDHGCVLARWLKMARSRANGRWCSRWICVCRKRCGCRRAHIEARDRLVAVAGRSLADHMSLWIFLALNRLGG